MTSTDVLGDDEVRLTITREISGGGDDVGDDVGADVG